MFKKYTILIVPEETNKVKRFNLPLLVIPIFVIILAGALALAGFWHHQYQMVCQDLPNLTALKRQNQYYESQLNSLAYRLGDIKQQMVGLKTFNQRLRTLACLEKPKEQDQIFGMGGPENTEGGPGIKLSHTARERRILSMQRDLDQLSAESEAQRLVQQELAKFLSERRSILASTPSVWPVQGWVTSGYGYRISPFTGKRQFHAGIDISTRRGTPVVAPAAGVVTFAGREGGFGRVLVINHGHGVVTRYAHLQKFKTKVAQKVKRGEVIATVGNSGRSTGPHLHYEVLLSGAPTNPRYYILD